jgi:hypothetical protein
MAGIFSLDGLQPAVDLAGHGRAVAVFSNLDLGGERALRSSPAARPASGRSGWQSSSMACLPRMTRPGCSPRPRLQDLGDGQRLGRFVGLDQDAAVGAHGERGADGFLRLLPGRWKRRRLLVAVPASFRRIASSTAISSNGFIDILTLARSTPVTGPA